jgi:hypothetical protein
LNLDRVAIFPDLAGHPDIDDVMAHDVSPFPAGCAGSLDQSESNRYCRIAHRPAL